jgi:hypothetical protein
VWVGSFIVFAVVVLLVVVNPIQIINRVVVGIPVQ